jgi:hypothetical protein
VIPPLRGLFGLSLAAMVAWSIPTGAQQGAGVPPFTSRRLALLVGVTDFIAPDMRKHNLRGPANDVALFRTLLISDRFGVPPDAIVTLAALPDDLTKRPTRANILREFRRLGEQAGAGDQVLILLAGHGSQQPANPDLTDEEPDGLDEIFLPADTNGWNAAAHQVTNAIVDDEIRQWVAAIRAKGAIVTIIVDACHSGTITRAGPMEARDRGIPIEELIPPPARANIRSDTRSATPGERSAAFDLADAQGDTTALYAADMAETTPELPMPDSAGPTQGLFTYTLTRILTERTGPITYRELVHRVIDQYRAGGFNPTPSLEGAGIDREVLGERTSHLRPTFAIDTKNGANNWTVNGGSIHGLTQGSILEILPAGDQARARPVGHVRVDKVYPTMAVVKPYAFANIRAPRAPQITTGSRARVKHHEFGALRLRVALQRSGADGAMAIAKTGTGPSPLERALKSLPTESNDLVQRVDSGDADWYVRVAKDRVVLAPATRHTSQRSDVSSPTDKRYDVGAVDDPRLAEVLADKLRSIARAVNLSRLASYVDPEADLQVHVRRYKSDPAIAEPLPAANGSAAVSAGEHLQFILENTGKTPLDITVLYIDANFGIIPLYPASDSALDNRLAPGERRALKPEEITDDPIGWESVVAIGVEATPRHENFLMLTQDALPEASRSSTPASPLRALLESAVHGTRSAKVDSDQDRGRFAITQTWFKVEAGR